MIATHSTLRTLFVAPKTSSSPSASLFHGWIGRTAALRLAIVLLAAGLGFCAVVGAQTAHFG
jgi:hypothetical protein